MAKGRDYYIDTDEDLATCTQRLIDSPIFSENKDYVRTQIIHSLLQEDEFGPLHTIANFLLLDGRAEEVTFRRMVTEGCFGRLLELIKSCGAKDSRLHRLVLELMYEMSRIERLRPEDLLQVDDGFVTYLFELIEALSDDAHDPYHYSVIRVLVCTIPPPYVQHCDGLETDYGEQLVLNEQYMVASTSAAVDPDSPSPPLTNRVVKVLSVHGLMFRTFGENIILLLNRETETALQLLILKLLYLLFTTTATCEYFYTNDLRVLLDVIIRNLLDLPVEMNVLRHTYLRVLAPLLAHTQLSQPPHYKRDQILSLLDILRGSGNVHFTPPEPTTLRLVERVGKTPWLLDDKDDETDMPPTRPQGCISLTQTGSTVSVIANVSEKPGIQTPSRKSDLGAQHNDGGDSDGLEMTKPRKIPPEVPKHRHGAPVVAQSLVKTLHLNGLGTKKQPPKIPPPRRRTKLKEVTRGDTCNTSEKPTPMEECVPGL